MAETKTLTFAVMDPPYETARSTTLLRLLAIAVRRVHNINVFAYEGAVYLPFALQKAHPNPAHGRNAEEENHVLTKDLIAALMATAEQSCAVRQWLMALPRTSTVKSPPAPCMIVVSQSMVSSCSSMVPR